MNAKIVTDGGISKIEINGKKYDFVGYRSWRPKASNLEAFDKMGVPFMTLLPSGIKNRFGIAYSEFGEYWQGDGIYDWDILRAQIDQFIESAPDTYLAINLMLDTRDWFRHEHPDCPNSFIYLSAAATYAPWIECAERMLRDTIAFLKREYPERIFAIFLAAGGTCEWHNKRLDVPECPSLLEHYRAWIGDPFAEIPSADELSHVSVGNLRDPEIDKNALSFLRYTNDVITDTLAHFAAYVKELTDDRLLVGAAAGYINVGEYPMSGHSGVADVMRISDIDIIVCPASYFHRSLDGVSGSQASPDSARVNGKFFIHSIDNVTYAGLSDPYAQMLEHAKHSSMQESVNYIRRECAFAMSKGAGFWFFDMYGCWYPDAKSRAELARIKDALALVNSVGVSYNAEIAFVTDPRSYYYTDKGALIKLEQVQQQITELGRIGAPIDYYCVEDLLSESFSSEQYKLYIFPNCIAPSHAIREAVSKLRNAGKSLIFFGLDGVVSDGCISLSAASDFVGMTLREHVGEERFAVVDSAFTDSGAPKVMGGSRNGTVLPLLTVDDPDVAVMGRDFLDGTPKIAKKERRGGFDVWTARGPIPECVLRPLALEAGVYIYQSHGLPTYASSTMAAFFDHRGGARKIRFSHLGKVREYYSGIEYESRGEELDITFEPNECKLFIYE